MTPLDFAILGAYLAGVLLLSAWLARRQASPEDYYVGGRALPWWALALSTLATQSSANSFLGIPAFVALVPGGGLTWLQYELALPAAMVIVMVLLVPVLRGLGLVSIYEYLEQRFDRPTRLLLSAVFLASRGLATGVALYAAAVVVRVCTGLPLGWSIALMAGATVAYDMLGGMVAVVWTDVLQMVMMLAGLVVCIAFAVNAAGGWAPLLSAIDPHRMHAIDPAHGLGDGATAPMWGFVVGGLALYVAYYGVDQTQVQRQLSAVNVQQAQWVLVANALARFPLTLLYAGLGLALSAVYARSPALQAAVPAGHWDYLVPRFAEMFLPSGLRGLLVAAVLAAAMSSLDSALNSLSAATMRDFVEARIAAPRRLRVARLVTMAWGAVITAVALQAGSFASNVIEGINRVGALFYGPLLAAFLCGILDRRATGTAVRAGVAAGLACNLALLLLWGPRVFWMWWNVTGLCAAAGVCWILSRLTPSAATPRAQKATLTRRTVLEAMRRQRAWVIVLLLYSLLMLVALLALGIKPDPTQGAA
ncbi:MAG: sodium/solute symporter [Burkholderiales bacterium]|nr:sodium/solute symporter [Burkholderiales bacterium]